MGDRPSSVRIQLEGPDGEILEPPTRIDADPAETIRSAQTWLVEQAGDYRATPGRRLGPAATSEPSRTGSLEDVMTPLAVAPARALLVAASPELIEQPVDGIEIDPESCRAECSASGAARVSWLATVRTGRFRKRAASLRLRPSPSNNLTIVELVPRHRIGFRTAAFVRVGVPAVNELCRRIRLAATDVAQVN